MKFFLGLLLVLPCIPPVFSQQLDSRDLAASQAAIKTIHPEAIRAHMRFLSDSMLQGRAPGTPGYDIAARYVATEVEGMGLKPAGANGTWYQPVPLRTAQTEPQYSSLAIVSNGRQDQLVEGKDFVMHNDVLRKESSVEAPVVFVGFGVTAPEEKYDDFTGIDVRGKIIAVIDGAPPRFPSTVRAYYSDGVVKAKIAVAHGAVGVLDIFLPEEWKRYPWDWIIPQVHSGGMRWLDPSGVPHDSFPDLRAGALLNQHAVEKLFVGSPESLDRAFADANASKPQAFALPITVRMQTRSTQAEINSSNIVAKLEGSDPALKDQYVVYTAHVDHLGLCPPIKGDKVCHGALDNASGTASLLEVARAFASMPKPSRRSVLFVFVTGEEKGLLGSDYFAHFPTVPLKSIVANVNIDGAPGLYYDMKDVVALGIEHSDIEKDVKAATRQLGYSISPDPMPEEVGFIRSDQYSFVLQGVPAVDVMDGVIASDPKINGLEVEKKWLVANYHTPLDNMDQPLDYQSGAKASGVNFLIGYEIAQQDRAPGWNPGDFFGQKFGARHEGNKGSD